MSWYVGGGLLVLSLSSHLTATHHPINAAKAAAEKRQLAPWSHVFLSRMLQQTLKVSTAATAGDEGEEASALAAGFFLRLRLPRRSDRRDSSASLIN